VNIHSALLQLLHADKQGKGNFATFHIECARRAIPSKKWSYNKTNRKTLEDYGRVVCYAM